LNPITTILNDGGCGSTPTPAVTFNATEGGAATSEFSAQANLGYCQGTMTGQSSFSTTLTFTPSAGGARSATLTATDQDGNVGVATVSGSGNQTAATPVIALAGGVYSGAQTVSIGDATLGATIYYTTDKSAPNPATSSVYSTPIPVSSVETIKAIATASGYSNSAVASVSYAIQATTPTFSQPSGIYGTAQTVTLSDGTPEATIHYTTDGSTPTANSDVYSGGILIASSTTLKVIAVAADYLPSPVATANYDITTLAAGGTLEWTWMSGSSTIGSDCITSSPGEPWQMTVCGRGGVYGTLGTPAVGNLPGSRVSPTTWTDGSGNLWLFGGAGYDANGNNGVLNDLWTFNPTTGLWTWMGGSSTESQAGVYGTMGTPGAGDIPGARFSSAVWTDKSGNVWLFGGQGQDANGNTGDLDDLWEFNPTNKLWTWMGGNSTVDSTGGEVGVYGTLGTPAAGNIPGGRSSTGTWTDASGNFWLFGGQGFDADGNFTSFGDFWEFDTSTLQWAWMGGNTVLHCGSSGCQQPSVYGSLGAPAAGNSPGTRTSPSSWTDKSGNFWMFGGDGGNDFWEFNPSTNLWAWMGGTGTINCAPSGCAVNGVYGTLGSPASGNFPGAHKNASDWVDSSGNLWLFGGTGTDANGSNGEMNDLWRFNPSTYQWTWMGGSSTLGSSCFNYYGSTICGQAGIYGSLEATAGGNFPGSRDSSTGSAGSAAWTDQKGNFWLFGGNAVDANGANGYLNDLWKYQATAPGSIGTGATKPFGHLDTAVDSVTANSPIGQADSVVISGWAADLIDGAPLSNVKVYIDGNLAGTPTLGVARPDVAAAKGAAYLNSGYTLTYPVAALALGSHAATAIAIDSGGRSTTFGPLAFTVAAVAGGALPVGHIDSAVDSVTASTTVGQSDSVAIRGWAADLVDHAPLSNVTVYIDGNSVGTPTLGLARPDVAAAFSNAGYLDSGYTLIYPVAALSLGSHAVTVIAIDSGGRSTTFGPLAFTVAATAGPAPPTPPFGSLDSALDSVTKSSTVAQSDSVVVKGWAADVVDGAPLSNVTVYIDGNTVGTPTLGIARADVAAAKGAAYLDSGYELSYSAAALDAGSHSVTVTVIDSGGRSRTFGPLTFTVP
jgi:N-acetylneuraminic acid mutarotase